MVLLAMVPPKGQVAFERNEPITVSPTNVADLSGQRTEGHYFQPSVFGLSLCGRSVEFDCCVP